MQLKSNLARRAVLALAAVTLVFGGTGAVAADAWRTFKRADLGYAIDLPAEPDVSTSKVDTAVGPIDATTVTVDLGADGALMIMSSDYKVSAPAEAMLDGAVSGVVGDSRELVSQTSVTVDGSPGRLIQVKDKAGTYVAADLIVAKGSALYQVLGIGPTSKGLPPNYERVRRSFRLLN